MERKSDDANKSVQSSFEKNRTLSNHTELNDDSTSFLENALLGAHLLQPSGKRVTTAEALQGSNVVAVYFLGSESMNSLCPTTERLKHFHAAVQGKIDIPVVCVCHHEDRKQFVSWFSKMPMAWLTIPSSTYFRKQNAWKKFVPRSRQEELLILQTDTGNVVSAKALDELTGLWEETKHSEAVNQKQKNYSRYAVRLVKEWEEEEGVDLQGYLKRNRKRRSQGPVISIVTEVFSRVSRSSERNRSRDQDDQSVSGHGSKTD